MHTRTHHLCSRFRHILSLVVLLAACAFLTHAADQPKDDLPPPLGGEGYLEERIAVAVFGESTGINSPLRQAALIAKARELGYFETNSPLRGETLTPYFAACVLLGSIPGNSPEFNLPFMLQAGDAAGCWSLEDSTKFRPLEGVLRVIRDNVPLASLADRTPRAVEESFIFQDGLLKSLRLQKEAFDRVAVSNFTIEELEANPRKYRGKVLKVYGHLKRIRQIDAPPLLRQFGAPKLYEVWVVVKSGDVWRQACLLTPIFFGFAPANEFPRNIEVELTGYFFKLFRYEKGNGVPGQPDRSVPLLLGHATASRADREVRVAMAAASLLAAGDGSTPGGFTQACLLRAGERAQCWVIEDPTRVPALDERYLDSVKDGTMMPRDIDINEKSQAETIAYYDAIIKANRTNLDRFQASLRTDVTYAHLHNEPQRYRGQVVRIDGLLRRVRRFDPTLYEKQNGVKDVYEVWLLNDKFSGTDKSGNKIYNAAVLMCTKLPPGVHVTEDIQAAVPVSFIGYFFKKYLYKPVEAKKETDYRVAPLLIGQILPPRKAADSGSSWLNMLVPFILLTLAGTFVIVFLMTWTSRRSDRRVLARVDALAPPFVAASEPPDERIIPKENEPPPEAERRI